MPKIIPPEVWENVDWSKLAREIADDLSLDVCTVRSYAKEHRKPLRDGRELWLARQAACGTQWKQVDWSQRDCDIARQVGVSRQRVWQMRRQLGKLNGQVED